LEYLGCATSIENGDIEATALSLRALQLYRLEGRRVEFERRVQSAGQWLAKANAGNTSDQNWKLLGLFWAKADPKLVKEAPLAVLRNQRADGGGAQLSGLQRDAYYQGPYRRYVNLALKFHSAPKGRQ